MSKSLINKYNVAGPRYTSYPTVPYWDMDNFSTKSWEQSLKKSYLETKDKGISLYIHLPYCESLCTFCGCHKHITKRHEVELPYIISLLKEWKLYVALLGEKPIISELHIGGGTPTFFSVLHLKYLLNEIFNNAIIAEEPEFSFEGHPNNTTKEHLQVLYDLGFRRVSFGVQDYNYNVQKAINRIQPFQNVKIATDVAREIGYTSVGHDIIFGLPFQSKADVISTIEKTNLLRPDRIAFYSYAHVPWIKGNGQRGFKDADLPNAKLKREQYEFGKQALEQSGYKEIGMDHFALPTDALYKALKTNKLHRNFMGYTTSNTQNMIGLGVSSISDSWYGFAQNEKSIKTYTELVDKGIIPVFKGHILNSEDLVIRKHILNLMCNFNTDLSMSFFNESIISEIIENLKEFKKDDLLKLDNTTISVTEEGKAFIRNICMAFDLRLQRKKPDTKLFSMTI